MNIIHKKYHLFPETILVREFEGTVSSKDIIESWEELIEKKMINSKLKGVINNLIECDLKMDIKSFNSVIMYIKKQKELKKIKLAVVCNSPRTFVFPILGEHRHKDLQIKPFSSIDAATNWILNK